MTNDKKFRDQGPCSQNVTEFIQKSDNTWTFYVWVFRYVSLKRYQTTQENCLLLKLVPILKIDKKFNLVPIFK